MAKRISKKAASAELKKEEPAIKVSTPVQDKKKPRAKKEKAEAIKKEEPAVKAVEAKKKKTVTKNATPVLKKETATKKPASGKAAPAEVKKGRVNRPAIRKEASGNAAKPTLRSVYSNSKYTLLVLGFGSDFNTKKSVVIFSDLLTGQVHTIALSLWNRWKLKEVKKINTET